MPSSDTEHEAEAGRSASSLVAPLNLEEIGQLEEPLKELKLDRVIEDPNWLNPGASDLQQRLIGIQYTFSSGPAFVPESVSGSDTSSKAMALSIASMSVADSSLSSHTFSSVAPPSLVSHSTIGTGSSAHTSLADVMVPNLVLDEDEDGTLLRPALPMLNLRCTFWFLRCNHHFDNVDEWDEHCKSHLGTPLPRATHCPLHCDWQTTSQTGEEAWQRRRLHIEEEHEMAGVVDMSSSPDPKLLHHLWSTNVINNAQLKDIKKNGQLTEESVTFIQNSRSDGRRREREIRPSRRGLVV